MELARWGSFGYSRRRFYAWLLSGPYASYAAESRSRLR
jgi:hypothetical protein